jgi:hypothetical protein
MTYLRDRGREEGERKGYGRVKKMELPAYIKTV